MSAVHRSSGGPATNGELFSTHRARAGISSSAISPCPHRAQASGHGGVRLASRSRRRRPELCPATHRPKPTSTRAAFPGNAGSGGGESDRRRGRPRRGTRAPPPRCRAARRLPVRQAVRPRLPTPASGRPTPPRVGAARRTDSRGTPMSTVPVGVVRGRCETTACSSAMIVPREACRANGALRRESNRAWRLGRIVPQIEASRSRCNAVSPLRSWPDSWRFSLSLRVERW